MNEMRKTQMQRDGECSVAHLTVLEIADIVRDLGLDPREIRVSPQGWLYTSNVRLMGGQAVTLK